MTDEITKPSAPQWVRVGPYTYTIVHDELTAFRAFREGCWGAIQYGSQKIILDPTTHPTVQAATLLHEIIHACWYAAGLKDMGEDDHEEHIVRAISRVLLGVMQKNPDVMEFLLYEQTESPA